MADPLGLLANPPGVNGASGAQPFTKPLGARPPAEPEGPAFKDVLMDQLSQVNRLQQDAEAAIEDVASGKRDDMDAVLVAKQKADIAFQMLLQVRNKMMDAYEEVKQMRV